MSGTADPSDFLDTLGIVMPQTAASFKLAVVKSVVSTKATLQFDGETVTSTLLYPAIQTSTYPYVLQVNDRVLVANVGHSGVILGKVV